MPIVEACTINDWRRLDPGGSRSIPARSPSSRRGMRVMSFSGRVRALELRLRHLDVTDRSLHVAIVCEASLPHGDSADALMPEEGLEPPTRGL